MLSPQALIKLIVSRSLPQGNVDGTQVEVPQRAGRYGEGAVLSYIRKNHLLADEGQYFVANAAQTSITGQTTAAFDATKPSILIANTDSSANPVPKRLYLDYIHILNGSTAYSNATSNTAAYWSIQLDSGNRYSSGGTQLTVNNPNMDSAQAATISKVYAGAIVTTAATGQLRTIVGQRLLRAPISATAMTLANLDEFHFNFGGVESGFASPVQASATLEATVVNKSFSAPPVVIGPGQSFLFNLNFISGGAVTAGTLVYEIGYWER